MSDEVLVKVDGVSKIFGTRSRVVAVDDVSLEIRAGESVGVVGESGSGKTTLGNMVSGLLKPTSGSIVVGGQPLNWGRSRPDRKVWKTVQMVFQDPYSSLNPAMSIVDIVAEPIVMWRKASWREARDLANALIEQVGLDPKVSHHFPSTLSGGQRQRVAIARALAVEPRLIVCDESVSALDVSVQAQILALLADLRRDTGVAYLFVTHDIGVVRIVSDRVLVMRKGQVVESLPSSELTVATVKNDYTRDLLAAVPALAGRA